MKKLKLIFSMLLICSMLNAQTDWHVSGNAGTDPTTEFVGTTDANDLSFRTSNTVKMQLETTGELGLGTTSPSSWFHVLTNGSGTVDAKEVFRTEVATNTESNWRMIKGSNNMMRLYNPSGGNDVFFQAPRGGMKISSGYNGTSVPAMEISGGNNSNADGNVLIGNFSSYSPSAKLHVKGNGYQYLFKLESSLVSTSTISVSNDEQHYYTSNQFAGSASQGAFNFDYSPSSNISDGIGTYFKAIGNSSTTLKGIQLAVTNTNSSTPTTTGLLVESTSNNASSGHNYTFIANCLGTNTHNIAGQFSAVNSNTSSNSGIFCTASNSVVVNAIYGESNHGTNSAVVSTGVVAKAFGGTTSIGLYATSTDGTNGDVFGVKSEVFNSAFSGTNAWYGVYGSAPVQTCGTGSCAGAAGFFSGDVYASNGSYSSSDFKIKDQV